MCAHKLTLTPEQWQTYLQIKNSFYFAFDVVLKDDKDAMAAWYTAQVLFAFTRILRNEESNTDKKLVARIMQDRRGRDILGLVGTGLRRQGHEDQARILDELQQGLLSNMAADVERAKIGKLAQQTPQGSHQCAPQFYHQLSHERRERQAFMQQLHDLCEDSQKLRMRFETFIQGAQERHQHQIQQMLLQHLPNKRPRTEKRQDSPGKE